VMVFVPMGKWQFGVAADLDARRLSEAAHAVVVLPNVRLNVLGFLSHPALDDALGVPSGNQSLRDQQLVLRWVRDNIERFGGDAGNVTLFGQSSGAQSACLHLFMPESRGLFQRMILESGSCVDYPAVPLKRDGVQHASRVFVSKVCPDAADVVGCLRALPVETFADWSRPDLQGGYGDDFLPQIDGEVLPADPATLLAAGAFERVPIVLGTLPNEWDVVKLYAGTEVPRPKSVLELAFFVSALYPDSWQDVLAYYAPAGTPDANANAIFGRITSDSWFHCPTRALARGVSAQGVATYLYSFALPPAVHGEDIDYVFGYPWISGQYQPPTFDVAAPVPLLPELVREVQTYWGTFALRGDPNTSGVRSWPRFDAASERHTIFDRMPGEGAHLDAGACDVWDAIRARER